VLVPNSWRPAPPLPLCGPPGWHSMMCGMLVRATALLLSTQGATAGQPFRPHRVPHAELAHGPDFSRSPAGLAFTKALSDVGMVTISDIPGYAALRREVLQGAHKCLQALPEELARGHTFEDGTVRTTLAMSDTSGTRDAWHGGESRCMSLRSQMSEFRTLVNDVSRAFSARLGEVLSFDDDLILASTDPEVSYESVEDLFNFGERLEHVHSYHLPQKHQTPGSVTMDFHTDQGLCIAFTPALIVDEHANGTTGASGGLSGKFEIQLRGGEQVPVEIQDDHLVFMLGDGVNQYVNSRAAGGPLRAVPHALTMPSHRADQWRLWYGRMFLPPADAMSEHGITYGAMRDELMEAWVSEDDLSERRLSMGCSGRQHARELRQLSDDPPCASGARRRCSGNCANNQLQCWWRCMNYTEAVSQEACTGAGYLYANCTNRRDEVSIGGKDHGGYELTCTNSTQPVRASCDLELINKDRPSNANAAGFEAFLANQGSFSGRNDLSEDAEGNPDVVFLWDVTDDGKVEALMAYNGMVSWMSWGIENLGGGLRGMKGAPVIFGISSEDTEYPALQGTVQEYKIDHDESRFRFWKEPYPNPATTDAGMISQGGYTAMKFKTDAIYGVKLNITSGSNRLIWAYRASSYMHVGKDSYHEACDGNTRTRGRGGGANDPWDLDFNIPSTTPKAQNQTTQATEEESISAAFAMHSPLTVVMVAGTLLVGITL